MAPGASISVGGFRITAPPLWLALALPLSYGAASALLLAAFGDNPPLWIPNALAVTALLRGKRSTWPVLLFLTTAADYIASIINHIPILGIGLALCDTVEILLVAALVRPKDMAWQEEGLWPKARFALACLVAPTVSATGGSGLLALAYGAPFLEGWKTWYLSSVCGLLIITPLLLSWTDPALRTDRRRGTVVLTLVLAGLVALMGFIDFNDVFPGLSVTFPLLLLAAFQGRLLGATTAAAALSAVVIWSTAQGHGPIAETARTNPVLKIELLQLYFMEIVLSTLPVAAILEQRDKLMVELRETTKAAQAAARAKSEFVAVISHEIRTPMTSVLGMADLLMNDDLSAKTREYVKSIQKSGLYLLSLINDILDFSRAEAKKIDLETIDFDLAEVLEQVRSLMAPQAGARGLELRFERDADLPTALGGDPTRLKQVLVNLVGNGIKFTERGSVTVTVRHGMANTGQDRFRFEVRDTGSGIPAEKQESLFNVFSQMDSSTTRQYGGTGLGLAISKKLVEAMDGVIGVESVPRVGSLFWFDIPLKRGTIKRPQAAEERTLVAGPPRRVLLVEDVELNRVLIADMLRSRGHAVTIAENGLEAVAAVEQEPFDLVLMDVQMPVMDGMEATRRIRRLPPPAGAVPILALSANVFPEDRDRYLAAGMNDALTKPIDWPQLFAALAKYGPPGESAETHEDAAGAEASLTMPEFPAAMAVMPSPTDPPLDDATFDRL